MIKIEERPTKKVVGDTSLFVSFPYNADIVSVCSSFSGCNYNKKDKEWEIPVTYLSELLDKLCILGDIEMSVLPDYNEETPYTKHTFNGKTEMFDYQKDGAEFCLSHERCLLLDVPGLGKTIQVLNVAEELRKEGAIKHCLIICGLNALKYNWKREIEKHTYSDSIILGERINRNGKSVIGSVKDRLGHLKTDIPQFYVITNLETLRDKDITEEILKGKNKFDMIVVDEIHKCKDSHTQGASNLLKLTESKYRIGLTGTLLLNNPMDAYVALRWIGAERSTQSNFKYFYVRFGGLFNNQILGYQHIDYLKDTLGKYALRRKKDMLKLPPKTIINEYVEMSPLQHTFYEQVKHGIRDSVDKVHLSTANLLALVARLRQATACPSMLTTEVIDSAKKERCIDLVEQIVSNGEKVVVFSTFKQTACEIADALSEFGSLLATGDIKDEVVNQRIVEFQTDPSKKVFVATWQKCGTGVTLTAANNVIFIDTPWTEADYSQAQDRCYRIGTTKNVTIYNLITKDTIDERVLEIITDKRAISSYIIDNEVPLDAIESLRKYIEDI